MALGLVDDRGHLDWRLRLVVQTVVAVVIVWQGWRLTAFIDAPLFTGILSVLWIVGIVNAFNMLDNMAGLSAGVAWIAAVILIAVILTAPDPQSTGPQLFVAGFLLVLAGALAGFWRYNRPPASIFMGDAGSYFVGFCIATATLMATFAGGGMPRHAVFAPLCVLGVPIYDMLTVVTIRVRAGRSPFEGDKNHFSHRLVALGLTPRQAVWTIYLLTTACGLGALLLHQVNELGAIVILVMVGCMLATIAILEATVRRDR
jgi:UDP-GlcNAc:undecaprenyl-phosphate GlcNAc-1-phosphate transferase